MEGQYEDINLRLRASEVATLHAALKDIQIVYTTSSNFFETFPIELINECNSIEILSLKSILHQDIRDYEKVAHLYKRYLINRKPTNNIDNFENIEKLSYDELYSIYKDGLVALLVRTNHGYIKITPAGERNDVSIMRCIFLKMGQKYLLKYQYIEIEKQNYLE